jgi:hypothetical protein
LLSSCFDESIHDYLSTSAGTTHQRSIYVYVREGFIERGDEAHRYTYFFMIS